MGAQESVARRGTYVWSCVVAILIALLLGLSIAPAAYADEALMLPVQEDTLVQEVVPDQELTLLLGQEPSLAPMSADNTGEDDQDTSLEPMDVADPTEVAIPAAVEGLVYDGSSKVGVLGGEAYQLDNAQATDAGTHTATATLIDTEAYVWSDGTTDPKSIVFVIEPAPLDGAEVSLAATTFTYSGSAQKPSVSAVTLPDGTVVPSDGYVVTYTNNVKAGTATCTVSGSGNYSGSVKTTFTISPRSLAKASIAAISAKQYSGKAIKPAPVVTWGGVRLKANTDYTVSYKSNTNAGTATVTVAGKGNYAGSAKKTFSIKPRDFSKAKVAKIAAKIYTGKAIKPAPVVKWGKTKLKKGVDYTVTYKGNKKAGTATVIVKGKGNYSTKQRLAKFKIAKRGLSATKVSLAFASTGWTGGKKTPAVTVRIAGTKLKRGVDYTVSYANNVEPGKARVTVMGKGSLTGSLTKTFTITKGGTVYLTRTGECYHRSWCSSLRKSRIPTTVYDARKRGYRPCRICNP